MKNIYAVLVLTFAIFTIKESYGQDDNIRDKIEDIKLEKMAKKLEMDETTKSQFIDKYKAFSKEMRELTRKRAKTYKEMAQKIEGGQGLDSLVDQLLDYENTITQKRKEFIAEMRSMLTSRQIAKMIIFERRFNNELKKLLKQYQKENKGNFRD